MKRRIGYLLICTMLLAAVWRPMPVRADITPDRIFEMRSVAATLNKGDTVEVGFYVYNYQLYGFEGVLEYDPTVLSMTDKDIVVSGNGWKQSYDKETGELKVTSDPLQAQYASYPLLTIRFKVDRSVSTTTVRLHGTKVNLSTGSRDYGTVRVTVNSSKTRNVTLSTSSVTGENWVLVPVRMTVNDGFTNISLLTIYDPAMLSLESVTFADSFRSRVTESNIRIQSGGKAIVDMVSSEEIRTTGDLMWLNFYVKNPWSSVSAYMMTSDVRVAVDSISGKDDIAYRTNEVTSTVSIGRTAHSMGDVNGDDKVDLVDALCVLQYYNNIRNLGVMELSAADVNKDGKVDLRDANYIIKYYNGEVTSLNGLQ